MLENIKYLVTLKSIDKNISDGNFELALEKLNFLIKEEFKPSQTYLKRGRLCKKLMMYDDAYSDFTYRIFDNDGDLILDKFLNGINSLFDEFQDSYAPSNSYQEKKIENYNYNWVKLLDIFGIQYK